MTIEEKEQAILYAGFGIYNVPDGHFAIADPHDNEDGFYLTSETWEDLIIESFRYIFLT